MKNSHKSVFSSNSDPTINEPCVIGETLLKYFLKIIFLKGLNEARKGLREKGKEMPRAN